MADSAFEKELCSLRREHSGGESDAFGFPIRVGQLQRTCSLGHDGVLYRRSHRTERSRDLIDILRPFPPRSNGRGMGCGLRNRSHGAVGGATGAGRLSSAREVGRPAESKVAAAKGTNAEDAGMMTDGRALIGRS